MMKYSYAIFLSLLTSLAFSQAPIPSFSTSPPAVTGTVTICQGSTVTYANTSTSTVPGTTYSWNFGLGAIPATAVGQGPHVVTYNTVTAPTTTATLTVTNPGFPAQNSTRTIDVNATPNAALTLASTGGGYGTVTQAGQVIFKNCGSIDTALFNFNSLYNNSVTQTFIWGDGSSSTNFGMTGLQISHLYPLGQFTMTHTVTQNGCSSTNTYIIFNGNAPLVTVAGAGTNTCLPSPYSIDIISNDVLVNYTVSFSDGSPSMNFSTFNDTTINHLFNTSSCGVDYVFAPGFPPIENAFSATVVAQNLCSNNGLPTVITIGPITISTGATAAFSYAPASPICVLDSVIFTNESDGGESINQSGCDTTYGFYWTISPNTYTINSGTLGSSNGFVGPTYDYTQWTNGTDDVEILFSQPGTYDVWVYAGNFCGADSIMQTVTIKPTASLSFSLYDQTICSGDSSAAFQMTANQPAYVITWNITDTTNVSNVTVMSGSGTTPLVFNPLLLLNNTNEPGTVEITASVECSTDPDDIHTITVNPQANVTIDPLFYEICGGETTDIDITSNIANVNFSWTTSGPASIVGEANGSGSNISQTLFNGSNSVDTMQYTVSVVNALCPGPDVVVSVAVIPQITVNTNPNFTVCPGETINPDNYISVPVGGVITWTNNNTNIGIGASGNGDLPTWNAVSNTTGSSITATISVDVQLGDCPAVNDQFTVTILPSPTFSYTTTPSSGLDCVTGIGIINGASNPTNVTVAWIGPGILSGGNTLNPSINAPGTYTVTLTDNVNSCVTIDTVIIEPPVLINITEVNVTNVSCNGGSNGSINIDTDNGNGSNLNYSWSPTQTNAATVNGLTAGNYTVTVTNADGCIDQATATVLEPTIITISVIDSIGSECGEANGSLSVMALGGQGGFSYSWSSGNTGATANNIDAGNYTVTATDAAGCKQTLSLDLGCDTLIPIIVNQFISPNNDNKNDLWIINNLELYPNNIVKVYNRWGSLVFEAEPYQNDWNGHYKGTAANSLPASTYFYVIDTKKKSQDPYTGYIEIQP